MGYEVCIINGSIEVPKENLDAAYAACVALNDNDDIKHGGRHPETEWDKSKDRWNPNKWFSWMPYDWPDKLPSLLELFEALGFDCGTDDEGTLLIHGYSSKMGNEEDFLRVIAPYVKSGGYLDWAGEDYAFWRHKFNDGGFEVVSLILAEGSELNYKGW